MKRLHLGGPLRHLLLERARAGAPEEVCGLLVGSRRGDDRRVTRTVACRNAAAAGERERRFSIDPLAVLELRRTLRGTGEELLGFYHSHPRGVAEPSPTDREYMALWPHTAWLIVSLEAEEGARALRAWWVDLPNGTSSAEPKEMEMGSVPAEGQRS